jgi:uncharacterized protein YndB with AHSA1/START domain
MLGAKSSPTVTVRRRIDASAEELFDAWLDPVSLAAWMVPRGITRSTATVEPRVGGRFEVVMDRAGEKLMHTGFYRTIDRPRRLVFTWISDETRDTESLVTVEFFAVDRATEVVVTHAQLPDVDVLASHTNGWTDALELLALRYASSRLSS